jgi:hypothetical protein
MDARRPPDRSVNGSPDKPQALLAKLLHTGFGRHPTFSVLLDINHRARPAATTIETSNVKCLLCHSADALFFMNVGDQTYHRCDACKLTFLDPAQMPTLDAERSTYDLHENDPDDIHYRAFLRRATEPLLEKIKAGSYGLDYGCGPGPALAAMLSERGFAMEVYDPLYANDEDVLEESYDFITCTEVAEHFHAPRKEFDQLNRMLAPGGWLAIMTSWLHDDIDFSTWHYRRDPTHVCFYQQKTFEHWAHNAGWTALFPENNIVLLQKPIT